MTAGAAGAGGAPTRPLRLVGLTVGDLVGTKVDAFTTTPVASMTNFT